MNIDTQEYKKSYYALERIRVTALRCVCIKEMLLATGDFITHLEGVKNKVTGVDKILRMEGLNFKNHFNSLVLGLQTINGNTLYNEADSLVAAIDKMIADNYDVSYVKEYITRFFTETVKRVNVYLDKGHDTFIYKTKDKSEILNLTLDEILSFLKHTIKVIRTLDSYFDVDTSTYEEARKEAREDALVYFNAILRGFDLIDNFAVSECHDGLTEVGEIDFSEKIPR